MADSAESVPEHGTSDFLTDPYCDPRFEDGTIRHVAGYCSNFVEFYCQNCLGVHRRSSMTKRHKILLGPDMPACQADKSVKYQLCDKHDGERKDRYCFDHGIIVCGICVIREHKHCQINHISDACKNFNISAEAKSFGANTELLLKHVKTMNESMKSNAKMLAKQKEDILKEAQEHRDKAIYQINKSHQEFNQELTRLFREQNAVFTMNQTTIDQVETDIDDTLKSIKQTETNKYNDQKGFLALQDSAEKIQLCEDKLNCMDLKCAQMQCTFHMTIQPLVATNRQFAELSLQTLKFQFDSQYPYIIYPYGSPHQCIAKTASESLGAVGERLPPPVKLALIDKVHVKIDSDKYQCGISGIDITADGNMLLMDVNNQKVKLFSSDGKFLAFLKLAMRSTCLAVITNRSEAAIPIPDTWIGVLDLSVRNTLSLKRIIKTEQNVSAVSFYQNYLIFSSYTSPESPRSVQMTDVEGKIFWTVTADNNRYNLFDRADYLTVRCGKHGDHVIVTDWKKQTITILDAHSGNVIKVCDVMGNVPRGVTFDGNGNIYVCYDSGQISVWSRSLEEERFLLLETALIENPYGMALYHKEGKLFVTSRSHDVAYCDFILRYKIN